MDWPFGNKKKWGIDRGRTPKELEFIKSNSFFIFIFISFSFSFMFISIFLNFVSLFSIFSIFPAFFNRIHFFVAAVASDPDARCTWASGSQPRSETARRCPAQTVARYSPRSPKETHCQPIEEHEELNTSSSVFRFGIGANTNGFNWGGNGSPKKSEMCAIPSSNKEGDEAFIWGDSESPVRKRLGGFGYSRVYNSMQIDPCETIIFKTKIWKIPGPQRGTIRMCKKRDFSGINKNHRKCD